MRTLVLDQSYLPHRIVSWQKAVSLWWSGKCEVVEEYDEDIRSTSITIKMPAVIRLFNRVSSIKKVKFSRVNVATRDNFQCCYCHKKLHLKKLTYDHVVPRSRNGKTNWQNIVSACYPCNGKKGNMTPEEAGMPLRVKPVRPKSLPVVRFMIDPAASLPEAWKNWVFWHGELKT